jgi:hypothetical protein
MKSIAIIDASSRGLPYDYYYIKELCRYFKVDFYCSKTNFNYEYVKLLKKEKNVNVFEYDISGFPKILAVKSYLKCLMSLLKRREKYYKIHFFWSILFPLEIPFFIFFKNKLIFTFHNDKPHEINKKTYLPYKLIYYLSRKVIFVSKFTKERFIKNYNIKNEDKLIVVNHGVLPLFPNHSIKIAKCLEKEKTIVFWGLVKDYKGVDIFLKLIEEPFFKDFNIEIFGKWDKYLKNLKKELSKYKRLKIMDKFLSLKDLESLLKRNVIFILPYKDSTQSGVLYTFLNYENVFVSSNVGENSQFLKNFELEELIFDRNDINSLVRAVSFAYENYFFIREKLKNIKKNYEWKNIINKEIIKNMYEE